MVVANLLIDPADVYLLPGDTIKYRILQVSNTWESVESWKWEL